MLIWWLNVVSSHLVLFKQNVGRCIKFKYLSLRCFTNHCVTSKLEYLKRLNIIGIWILDAWMNANSTTTGKRRRPYVFTHNDICARRSISRAVKYNRTLLFEITLFVLKCSYPIKMSSEKYQLFTTPSPLKAIHTLILQRPMLRNVIFHCGMSLVSYSVIGTFYTHAHFSSGSIAKFHSLGINIPSLAINCPPLPGYTSYGTDGCCTWFINRPSID